MAASMALAAANLSTAMVLGALIGSERQLRQRMAGLRTNALAALGAAGVGLLSGSGQWPLAALLTGHVVFINFGLRPVVRWLKRLAAQSDKAARQFRISLTCRADQEIQGRSLMVQAFALAECTLAGWNRAMPIRPTAWWSRRWRPHRGPPRPGWSRWLGDCRWTRRSVRCAGGARMTSDSKVPCRHSQRFPAAAAMLDLPQRGG